MGGGQIYWLGNVPQFDDFGSLVITQFVAGKTSSGLWALMSLLSFRTHGVGIGPGLGQRYVKQQDGRWLKMEGET
jgi:hypothetical protein